MMDMRLRTKRFALDVIRFCSKLPGRPEIVVIRNQLLRAATSVGANYRASQRAQSTAHFLTKLALVEEEADESMYWMEMLEELGWKDDPELMRLLGEANELVAITVASKRTARGLPRPRTAG